jgi:uncharacterized membrane protein
MKSRYAWVLGIGVGVVVGYLFGIRYGDILIGGGITIGWSLAGYGFFRFPEYRTRWSGSHPAFWYHLIALLGIPVMIVTPHSMFLSDEPPVVFFLGGLWLGAVYAGIALERSAADHSE